MHCIRIFAKVQRDGCNSMRWERGIERDRESARSVSVICGSVSVWKCEAERDREGTRSVSVMCTWECKYVGMRDSRDIDSARSVSAICIWEFVECLRCDVHIGLWYVYGSAQSYWGTARWMCIDVCVAFRNVWVCMKVYIEYVWEYTCNENIYTVYVNLRKCIELLRYSEMYVYIFALPFKMCVCVCMNTHTHTHTHT